jgi:hypothetical protein
MPQLIGIVLIAIYVFGVWKFVAGFNRTNFSSNRVILGLLWPALLFNRNYRGNFVKTLKGE